MLIRLFMQILDMTVRGSVVIAGVFLVRLLLKKVPKIYSYGLWALVLFRLLCPVTVQAPVSAVPEFTPVSQTYTLVDTPISVVDAGAAAYQTVESALTGQTGTQQIQTQQINLDGNQETVTADWWEVWVLFGQYIWLAGVLGLLGYSVIVYWKLRRCLKGATLLQERTYLSDSIPTPFVLGLLRPKIYLPAFIGEGERSYIIAHEQHHIRRLDHVIKLIAFATLAMHWFNPLVWLAYILFCKDMEMSCDEAVIKKLGPEIRADYATSLLNLATNRHFVSVTPLAFGEGDTKGRVKNMSKWKKPKLWICIAAAVLILGVAVVLLTDPLKKANPETPLPEETIIRDGPMYHLTGGDKPEHVFRNIRYYSVGYSPSLLVGGLNPEKMHISSVQHLPIYKFDTRQELDAFLENLKQCLPESISEPVTIYEGMEQYDEKFFRDQTLMMVYVPVPDSEYLATVEEIFCDGRAFVLHLVSDDYGGDTVMSGEFVSVAVPDMMVASCTDFDADLNNVNYEYPRVAYSQSGAESSTYTVTIQIPQTDRSQIPQEAKQLVEQEKVSYNGYVWRSVDIYADSWKEAQEKIGISVRNPLEKLDGLRELEYNTTGLPELPRAVIHMDINWSSEQIMQIDKKIVQIDLQTSYIMDDIRVQANASIIYEGGGVWAVGAGCGGYAAFSQTKITTDSGKKVLLVRADHTNNYSNLEAYWIDGYVLYRIFLVGPKGADARLLDAMNKVLAEV